MVKENGCDDPSHIGQNIKGDDMAQSEEAERQRVTGLFQLIFPRADVNAPQKLHKINDGGMVDDDEEDELDGHGVVVTP